MDTIFYCTGYHFSFPFLEEDTVTLCGKKQPTKGFGPLYLRSVHVKNPRLLFVGFIENIPIFQHIFEWHAILAASVILGRRKWSLSALSALHEAEIAEARTHDPDLSCFNTCSDHYPAFTHLKKLKEASRVTPEFNKAEEEVMRRYVERLISIKLLNPFTMKQTSFKDLTLQAKS